MAPHRTEPNEVVDESERIDCQLDELIDKAAHLVREQEMFLLELDNFKVRLEQVERHMTLFKRR